jgi:hypothetical protein
MSFMLLGILNSQAAGGGGGSYDLLETTTLTSNSSGITFTNVDAYSDYTHLQIRYVARTNRSSSVDLLNLRLNSDSGSNYSSHSVKSDGSLVSNAYASETNMRIGHLTAATAPSGTFAAGYINILDAFKTTKKKTVMSLTGVANPNEIVLSSGLWDNTSAVTTIAFGNLSALFLIGTRFSLIGIK